MRQRGAYPFKILSPTLTHGAQRHPLDLKSRSTETPKVPYANPLRTRRNSLVAFHFAVADVDDPIGMLGNIVFVSHE